MKRLVRPLKRLTHHRVNIPIALPYKQEMQRQVILDKGNFRSKSEWVEEAVVDLLENPNWINWVLDGDFPDHRFDSSESVLLTHLTYRKVQQRVDALTVLVLLSRFTENGTVKAQQLPALIADSIDEQMDYRTHQVPTLTSVVRSALYARLLFKKSGVRIF